MYLSGNARRLRYAVGLLVVIGGAALYRGALAAPSSSAERAKALLAELEAEPAGRELVAPAVEHAKESLSRAEAATSVPARATLLGDTALEWAEVARDLKRASLAEQASDRLERDAAALQTELARMRAAVEQAMARVGQVRREVDELEAAKGTSGGARSAPATSPSTAPAPSRESR